MCNYPNLFLSWLIVYIVSNAATVQSIFSYHVVSFTLFPFSLSGGLWVLLKLYSVCVVWWCANECLRVWFYLISEWEVGFSVFVCWWVCVCLYVCVCECVYVCVCSVCVYVCVCVCVFGVPVGGWLGGQEFVYEWYSKISLFSVLITF